jgi:hypothetical protein
MRAVRPRIGATATQVAIDERFKRNRNVQPTAPLDVILHQKSRRTPGNMGC